MLPTLDEEAPKRSTAAQATFEARQGFGDLERGHEAPHVDVTCLAQHLPERTIADRPRRAAQDALKLGDAHVFVPEEVGPTIALGQIGGEWTHGAEGLHGSSDDDVRLEIREVARYTRNDGEQRAIRRLERIDG